jgi:hypothetical protein
MRSISELIEHEGLIRPISLKLLAQHYHVNSLRALLAAVKIRAKASVLGYGSGSEAISITPVPGGYVARFEGNDIYAAFAGEAYEVQGDIRAKYEALGGAAGPLELPLTDEMTTPDGVGRYNHFEGGSIYWTPRTGPMMVRGKVRDRWAASGWELGPLGYPVQDQHQLRLHGPLPVIEWCKFENGLIAEDSRAVLPAPMMLQSDSETFGRGAFALEEPALLTYEQLGAVIGNRINEQFVASPDNVGLRPGVELTGVSNWRYGFSASIPRFVGFRLHGFHDNGLAPDTDFVIDIRLRFELYWDTHMSFEPSQKALGALLEYLNVGRDGGLALAQIYASVDGAIWEAFLTPDPSHPEVPSGAIHIADVPTNVNLDTGDIDILDVLISTKGELQILVNPLAPPQADLNDISYTYFRQSVVQRALDEMR